MRLGSHDAIGALQVWISDRAGGAGVPLPEPRLTVFRSQRNSHVDAKGLVLAAVNSRQDRIFVGFGFGAIQAGLFLYEAERSGRFDRLVVAEVVPEVVEALRASRGTYHLNVATPAGIRQERVGHVEIYSPLDNRDSERLGEALAGASEICTALPSVEFYGAGLGSVTSYIANAVRRKEMDPKLPDAVVYSAENHNCAAEILEASCLHEIGGSRTQTGAGRVQFLNTVIGKMSGVVSDPGEIQKAGLLALAPGLEKAYLVEEFSRILISKISLRDFSRGLQAFVEKADLLPYEQAKLYGHNAVHALVGYLARLRGYRLMSEVADDPALKALALEALLEECGPGLAARHGGRDELFTTAGFRTYAEDLITRMTNPWLRDRVDRVTRDTPRKLGWDDRLVGSMRMVMDAGIPPRRLALGAAGALVTLSPPPGNESEIQALWAEPDDPLGRKADLARLIHGARTGLASLDAR